MSTINIIIEGEAADTFAQKLLNIPGISLRENEQTKIYKSGKVEKIIYLTAAIYTITQGLKSDIKDIVNTYNYLRGQQQLEVTIENPAERTFTEFDDWLASGNLDSLESSNKDFPSVSLPSLQEIGKNSGGRWSEQAGYEARKLFSNLQHKSEQWWYFLDHPEIPPDNNIAERTLRLAITKRKVSGGSRSLKRFKQTANLLTVVQTCRCQARSVIEFFEQSLMVKAGHGNFSVPTLIPIS